MTLMLVDLTSCRRTTKEKFGKEPKDSTIPSRTTFKEKDVEV
jgi:hypothetical protein